MLIDKEMNKTELANLANVSTFTIAKMTKGENVTVEVLAKNFEVLNCDIDDIMELIHTDKVD